MPCFSQTTRLFSSFIYQTTTTTICSAMFDKKMSAYRLINLSGWAGERRKQFALKFRFPLITFSLVY